MLRNFRQNITTSDLPTINWGEQKVRLKICNTIKQSAIFG